MTERKDFAWLDEIEARLKAASPGPWSMTIRENGRGKIDEWVIHLTEKDARWDSYGWGCLDRIIVYGRGLGQNQINPPTEENVSRATANTEFIAHAPTDIAKLIETVKVMREALEFYAGLYGYLSVDPRDSRRINEIARDALEKCK